MSQQLVVLTADAQEHLRKLPSHAYFSAAYDDDLFYVTEAQDPTTGLRYGSGVLVARHHRMSNATSTVQGAFHRVPANAHHLHRAAHIRAASVTFDGLRELVPELQISAGGLVITQARDHDEHGVPEFAAWRITQDSAIGIALDAEPPDVGVGALNGRWPIHVAQRSHVLVVGTGTIGTATALGFGAYGIGQLTLIDPERLRYGNLRRLGLSKDDVGRYKSEVVAERISRDWPDTRVTARSEDIVDAIDGYRELGGEADLIVCTTDGVLARRVCSYLGQRNGIDVVLGCVLDDGAITEVLRLRAGSTFGCLDCQRRALAEQGALDASFEPELTLHAPYGDGYLHKPMTAVGGDLALAGTLTAKVAVSTLLENAGHGEHALPGDALIVSNTATSLAAPFGASAAVHQTWLPATRPRPGCFTCRTDIGQDVA